MTKHKHLIVSSVFLLLLSGVVHAQGSGRKGLVSIEGMRVVIEPFAQIVEDAGVNLPQIQADVELRLRRAGITVVGANVKQLVRSDGKTVEFESVPYLYVNINAASGTPRGLHVANIEVECHREGTFKGVREPVFATVWSNGYILVYSKEFSAGARETINDLVDHFINDYLAANPKP